MARPPHSGRDMPYYHFVARAPEGNPVFDSDPLALATWRGLKKIFPTAAATVLMPSHLHVLSREKHPKEILRKISGLLSILTRWHSLETAFEPVPLPPPIESGDKPERRLRYVFLNPCRDRLCEDPLEWRWSSYRQALGMGHGQWTDFAPLRLGRTPRTTERESLHSYVSSDPSVKVGGTPLPKAVPSITREYDRSTSLPVIFQAAWAAHPEELHYGSSPVTASFIWLAADQGWRDTGVLSRFLGISHSGVQYWLDRSPQDPRVLQAERYCLADPRLRRWVVPLLSSVTTPAAAKMKRLARPYRQKL